MGGSGIDSRAARRATNGGVPEVEVRLLGELAECVILRNLQQHRAIGRRSFWVRWIAW